jgi:hypothetical protein
MRITSNTQTPVGVKDALPVVITTEWESLQTRKTPIGVKDALPVVITTG